MYEPGRINGYRAVFDDLVSTRAAADGEVGAE